MRFARYRRTALQAAKARVYDGRSPQLRREQPWSSASSGRSRSPAAARPPASAGSGSARCRPGSWLPTETTTFTGREGKLAATEELLGPSRLLTLTRRRARGIWRELGDDVRVASCLGDLGAAASVREDYPEARAMSAAAAAALARQFQEES